MLDFRSWLWIFPVVALVGAGGAMLGDALSALAAAAAVLLPAEWLRAKAASAKPQNALPLALAKFTLTTLLLAAAAAAIGTNLSPPAFILGVVLVALFSVLRVAIPAQPPGPAQVQAGGKS